MNGITSARVRVMATALSSLAISCQSPLPKGAVVEVPRAPSSTPKQGEGARAPKPCEPHARSIVGISAGERFSCALSKMGTVVCWGSNEDGELGHGDTAPRGKALNTVPSIDLGRVRVTSLASAGAHTCILAMDGRVACWGSNLGGSLGIGKLGISFNRGDEPHEMGEFLTFVDLGKNRTATAIAVGSGHVCAVLDNRALKCWGTNGSGELGQGDQENRGQLAENMGDALLPVELGTNRTVRKVSVGQRHTCAILDDDSLKCWGNNEFGQLGLGDTKARGGKPGEMGDALPTVDLGSGRTAREVAASSQHTCALLDDYTIKCWGANFSACLGQGDSVQRGDNPGEMGDRLRPVDLGTPMHPVGIVACGFRTCSIFENYSLKCWGGNSFGVLGLGDTKDRGNKRVQMGSRLPFVDVGTNRTVRALAAGSLHTCALIDDGSVKCWGFGEGGVLGYGGTENRGDAPNEMGDALPALEFIPECDVPPELHSVDPVFPRSE
jgi:alpha-tubulin suppressor-like RCC1 family protein